MTEWTRETMAQRLVRYADLVPCRTAFIDTRTPGSTEKENFTIIGPGVSESADQFVHITERHGFNIGAARQPYGCVNSQHSHDTAEVFLVHSGQWRLLFGPNCEDGTLDIGPGDVVSVPTQMFRGFEKIDEGLGMLFTVLGEDDPGHVTWAPAVFEAAESHGLKLSKGGLLIDTSTGEHVLREVELEQPLDDEHLGRLITPPLEKLRQCIVRAGEARANPDSMLSGDGVVEGAIIGVSPSDDGFQAGPIAGWWPHGFHVRQLVMQTGSYVPAHARQEAEVIIMQEGTLEVSWAGGSLILGAGDTLTMPIGLPHAFRNTASVPMVAFIVRGTDNPAPPVFS